MAGNKDWIGNVALIRQGIPDGGLNFYVLSRKGVKNLAPQSESFASQVGKTYVTIPPVSEVLGCYFMPYVDYNDCLTTEVDYDEQAFPLPYNNDDNQLTNYTVTRLNSLGNSGIKEVGTFPKYWIEKTDIGGTFIWQNEAKLHLYPYTQIIAYDNISDAFLINPLLIKDELSDFKIMCRNTLNQLGKYTLYVDNYRGMSQGELYGTTTSSGSLPILSSNYTDYMSQNQFNLKSQHTGTLMNMLTGIVSNPLGSIAGALKEYGDSRLGEVNALQSGYSLSDNGGDIIHSLQTFGGMTVCYQQPREEDMQRMAEYFHLYGYAQNKIKTPMITGRKYWNYVETQDVRLKVPNCPKEHLQQLKDIFNQGVTVWHVENGEMFTTWWKDNVEI